VDLHSVVRWCAASTSRQEDGHGEDRGGIVIGRPVEDVFDFVADERNEPLYNPRMIRAEKVTPGPVDKGPAGRPPSRREDDPSTWSSS